MKRYICIALCTIHLLALASCTYIAAIKIESILITGLVCSATGITAGVSALPCSSQPHDICCSISTMG